MEYIFFDYKLYSVLPRFLEMARLKFMYSDVDNEIYS